MNHIVSADVGNGGSNFVISKRGKSIAFPYHYYPSVRARSTARQEWGLDIAYRQYEWQGELWIVGDDVVNYAKTLPQTQRGVNRYGSDFHQFMIAMAMANAELPDGNVDLIVYCPPSVYVTDGSRIKSAFLGQEASIHVVGEKNPRHWLYENVTVMPECYAASLCFLLDSNGKEYNSDFLAGNTLFVDIGVHTADFIVLRDGAPVLEEFPSATYAGISVDQFVRSEMLQWLKADSNQYSKLTVEHLDQVIRDAYAEYNGERFVLNYGGTRDITYEMQVFGDHLAEAVYQVMESDFDGLENINKLVLVGGGALMVDSYLSRLYDGKVVDTKNYHTTANLHPIHFNAMGGIRAALRRRAIG